MRCLGKFRYNLFRCLRARGRKCEHPLGLGQNPTLEFTLSRFVSDTFHILFKLTVNRPRSDWCFLKGETNRFGVNTKIGFGLRPRGWPVFPYRDRATPKDAPARAECASSPTVDVCFDDPSVEVPDEGFDGACFVRRSLYTPARVRVQRRRADELQ
jgi:hypothetical protein